MQYLSLPKQVIHQVEVVCRNFMWTGTDKVNYKSHVSWKSVCKPKNKGGLDVIDLKAWNQACMAKNLWNLSGKFDNLWIRWIHYYYTKHHDILTMTSKKSNSWIMKKMLKVRGDTGQLPEWKTMLASNTKVVYLGLLGDNHNVFWISVMYGNMEKPKAIHTLWMACHSKLATKERLM